MAVKTLVISNRQSLFDIANQEYGNAQGAFEIARANNLSTTDSLEPGQSIIIPESKTKKTEVMAVIDRQRIKFSTAVNMTDFEPRQKGIGYMRIGSTFKVK